MSGATTSKSNAQGNGSAQTGLSASFLFWILLVIVLIPSGLFTLKSYLQLDEILTPAYSP